MLKFTYSKAILGIITFIYVFSFAICSFDFNGGDGHSWDDHFPGLHCAGDLDNFVPPGDRGSSLIITASSLIRLSQIREPTLPLLSFSIFRPPQSAKIFLHV